MYRHDLHKVLCQKPASQVYEALPITYEDYNMINMF